MHTLCFIVTKVTWNQGRLPHGCPGALQCACMQTEEGSHRRHLNYNGHRRLLQSDAKGVTVVNTPLELMAAVEKAATHIEIREHLDLTQMEPLDSNPPIALLNDEDDSTKDFGFSIRVRRRWNKCSQFQEF